MISVVLVIHLILAVSIIGLILIQRSEGGGIGLGSGGGLGSFATPQATAGALNKVTWYCAGGFFLTSLLLGVLYNHASAGRGSILDHLDKAPISAPATAGEDQASTSPEPEAPAPKAKVKTGATKTETKSKKSEPSVPVTP
ncbi:MAG: Preprotein translocase subunit SecG [Micavibrio sp.]|nr:Preprotein translocase subunit SecG [Micavibrio sp.]